MAEWIWLLLHSDCDATWTKRVGQTANFMTCREAHSPGNIGIKKLSPLKIRVADRATETLTPTTCSVTTEVAS